MHGAEFSEECPEASREAIGSMGVAGCLRPEQSTTECFSE